MCYLTDTRYEDGTVKPTSVLEYISNELMLDNMSFSDPLYRHTFELAKQYIDGYYRDLESFKAQLEERIREYFDEEMKELDNNELDALDSTALILAQEQKEKTATSRANVRANNDLMEFSSGYLMKALCSLDDDSVRQLACELATDNLPQLSKIHTQFAVIVEERDKLVYLVPEQLYNWKNALLIMHINDVKAQIAHADASQLPQLLEQLQELYQVRHQLAAIIGDRVVNPH
jgi:hypothetical protein